MTGKSHVVVNTAFAYAIFGSPEVAILAAICAKLPDQMEIFLPGVPHRKVTHLMIAWLLGAIFFGTGYLCPWMPLFDWEGGPIARLILFAIFLGGSLHVIADFFSVSGVPIFMFGKGVGLKWYTTGTLSEFFALCGGVIIAGVIFASKNGYAQMPGLLNGLHI